MLALNDQLVTHIYNAPSGHITAVKGFPHLWHDLHAKQAQIIRILLERGITYGAVTGRNG